MNMFETCSKFGVFAKEFRSINDGIINSTILVTDQRNKKYILQEINDYVFEDVDALMNNIFLVTNYIRIRNKMYGGVGTLKLLEANNEKYYVCCQDENQKTHYYRMYDYIENAKAYNKASEKLLFEAGVGFGNFQKQLQDFPVEKLVEIIPNFHNTPSRFEKFANSFGKIIEKDVNSQRLKKANDQIVYAFVNENYSHYIHDALVSGKIPTRVVHNDTKLNNVMIDQTSNKVVAVIDLDTVMPGSLLYDYGDAIRYSSNTAKEDDKNLENVDIDMGKLQAFTKGFLSETSSILTKRELELMPYAPVVIAYELGLRFLTDYLDGDKYFKCDPERPDHNLERAAAQFALAEKFKEKQDEITKVIFEEYQNSMTKDEKQNSKS